MYRQHRDRIDELFVDNIEVALRGVDLSKEMKIAEEMLNPTERQSVEQTPDNPGILARVWRPVKKLLLKLQKQLLVHLQFPH